MGVRDDLVAVLQGFAPNKYKHLIHQGHKRIFSRFILTLVACLLVMVLVSIPVLFSIPSSFKQQSSAFDKFVINFDVSMNKPVVLTKYPPVVIDLEKTNRTNERFLFNLEGIQYKKFFSERSISWESLTSVTDNVDKYSDWLVIVGILLLPSLFLTLFLLFFLESVVVAFVVWIVAFIVIKLCKYKISSKQLTKIVLLALPPFVIIQVLPFMYIQLFLVPIALYIVLVALGVFVLGKSRFEKF